MAAILDTLRSSSSPFVAFVGAGASAMPPSRLPSWKGFNTLLLECLCERLDEYSRNRQPTAAILEVFKGRRDEAKLLAPDFQAQLMEEEVGADYFAVWQSIDTVDFGPIHEALAELALRDRLVAVVTTNFDRLVEIAMQKRGVAHCVYHNAAGFELLLSSLDAEPPQLPIVKLHGSIEDASSLVDTLRQRIVGRPPALQAALRRLLESAPWIFVGWSGADLNYNPHYLGLFDAADVAKGLVHTRRRGDTLEHGVKTIVETYQSVDPGKAEALEIEGETWLAKTFGLPPWTPPAETDRRSQADVDARVKANIHMWVDRLGPVAVVNIICAMLNSSGLDHEAWWLLRQTFRSYRAPDDTRIASYQRYNYNYGVSLLESGFIRNPVALAEDSSNLSEWKAHADQNGFEFLSRAYTEGGLLPAGGALAALLAYRGEVGRGLSLAAAATDEALKRKAWIDLCDIAIHSVVLYDLVQSFTPAIRHLEFCLEKVVALGDEPRRAMLCAHLGRLLTYARKFDQADTRLNEAEKIAVRLGLSKASLTTRAARGLWWHESGSSPAQALTLLQSVTADIRTLESEPLVTKVNLADSSSSPTTLKARQPMLCRVLLDLTSAALTMGDGHTVNRSLDALDKLIVENVNGYAPHYYFIYAQCLMLSEPTDPEQALALVRSAREVGKESGNPWVALYADHLEPKIRAMLPKD